MSRARALVRELTPLLGDGLTGAILDADQSDEAGIHEQRKRVGLLKDVLGRTDRRHAELRGISTGDLVDLSSRVGSTTLRAQVSERMPAGVVYTTFHHPVTGANVVTTENSDWATNCPEYKVTAVEVQPVD